MDSQPADLEELVNRLGGDRACLAELIDIFLDDARARTDEVRREEGNLAALRRVAHTLKGAAGNLCAMAASRAAAQLEAAAARGDQPSAGAARLALLDEMNRLIAQLVNARVAGAAGSGQ